MKRLLDLARTACKGRDEPILYLCHKFNSATKDGRDMKRYSLRLDQAIRSMIEVKEESDIDNLFTPGTTVQAITYGDGPSVVIEAVGHPDIFRAAVDKVCFAGRVVHIGYAKEAVS